MSRRQARETALKVLFQVDVGKIPWQDALAYMTEEDGIDSRDVPFLNKLVGGAVAHQAEIDELLAGMSVDWKLERMSGTDRSILRMAAYEILHSPDVPPGVTVNEAVELAKTYGDESSGRFVNGILGTLVRRGQSKGSPEE